MKKMSEHRYDIKNIGSCVDPNPLRDERQDPDNFPRLQTRERCALEIAAYVFKVEKPGMGVVKKLFCGFPGYKPVLQGWFKICVCFITGTPKGSPKVVLWRSRESNLRPLVYKA